MRVLLSFIFSSFFFYPIFGRSISFADHVRHFDWGAGETVEPEFGSGRVYK